MNVVSNMPHVSNSLGLNGGFIRAWSAEGLKGNKNREITATHSQPGKRPCFVKTAVPSRGRNASCACLSELYFSFLSRGKSHSALIHSGLICLFYLKDIGEKDINIHSRDLKIAEGVGHHI